MATQTRAEMTREVGKSVGTALNLWNKTYNTAWTLGENWTNVGQKFETFVNKFLFPKINETALVSVALGNSFDSFAKEVDFVGQYSEEYVIMDAVPNTLDLTQPEELMLKRNYPKMATKLYGAGIIKKQKFTLNNNDVRQNFLTLGDATKYAMGVYTKRISDINVTEEREIRSMLVDYALNQAKEKRTVASEQALIDGIGEAIMNLQNNSDLYNEASKASGGEIGRYTTVTDLSKICILTTDKIKSYLLNTKLANTFASEGIDFSSRIISFNTLGGNYRVTEDVTITDDTTLKTLQAMGDYQTKSGDIIPSGAVITFDVSKLTDFTGKVEELKPTNDLFAMVFDINGLKYRRSTKGMLKPPFYNGEYDEATYWLHYYSFKSFSPFYNKITLVGE